MLLILQEDQFFEEPPKLGDPISINDWAQNEADVITECLNDAFLKGRVSAASNLHRFNEAELDERYPAIGDFGQADILEGRGNEKTQAQIEVAENALETVFFSLHKEVRSAMHGHGQTRRRSALEGVR